MAAENSDFGIVVRTAGGPETLEWTVLPTAAPGPGEVRILQKAIGVNFIDTYFRKGIYPWPTTPLIPGGEAAGIVDALGEGVADFKIGDRVAYVLPSGAYRTRRAVAADRLVKIPDGIDFDAAASLMLKGLTAQFLLNSCYPVKAGDVVLVHAAAGGVGLLMGQWLKGLRATAIGTAGTTEKVAMAKANGYAHVIDYRTEDFAARVKEITGGKGCDVVYDSVGNDTWRGSLKCLKTRGMFVCFGQSSGAVADFKLADLAAGGSLYACRPTLFDYIKSREDLRSRAAELFAKLASGAVSAHIGQRVALRDAANAHRDLEARKTIGSTVLLV
jgi:NADPH2:quinone reductase